MPKGEWKHHIPNSNKGKKHADKLAATKTVPKDTFRNSCIRLVTARQGWNIVKNRVPQLSGKPCPGHFIANTCMQKMHDNPRLECQVCETMNNDVLRTAGQAYEFSQNAVADISTDEGKAFLLRLPAARCCCG